MLRPKLLDTMKSYSWKQLQHDCISGVIVGIVALPLAIAFAIASGVSPEKGLITAVIAGFIISAFGGSRVQIGGPTGAFVVIVYSIIQQYGIEGLTIATIMAGIILIVFGLARFGGLIKFIPYPVIIGFTSGIAVIIFSSQIKDFFGLDLGTVPPDFFDKWKLFFAHFNAINFSALSISAVTIGIVLGFQKITKKIPGSLAAIIFTTIVVQIFNFPVETIGDRFGIISCSLQFPKFPDMDWQLIHQMFRPAFTIAILAGIESLLSAVVADGMIGGKHRSNMELIAQGMANIASALFGGIPATGAIARTATNVHNGGRTPVAGIVHAMVLFLIMIFLGKWASLIPLATLAGILVIVSYRMGEWHSFAMILKSSRSDVFVLITTFLLTIIFDLTVAIEAGIILAALLLIRRLSASDSIYQIQGVYIDEEDRDDPEALNQKIIPKGAEVYEINGPFFFGVVSTFLETMNNIEKKPRVRILRMRHVSSIDATALNALRQVILESTKKKVIMVLSGVSAKLLAKLERADIIALVGKDNVAANIDKALQRAAEIIDSGKDRII